MSDNHIYTEEMRNLARQLSRKGCTEPGREAIKRLGIERSVKKKFYDYYLDKKMKGEA